jgi:hypothetical protein
MTKAPMCQQPNISTLMYLCPIIPTAKALVFGNIDTDELWAVEISTHSSSELLKYRPNNINFAEEMGCVFILLSFISSVFQVFFVGILTHISIIGISG